MADKSAEKERLFNEWFTKSYDRLRGTLRRYGMLDACNQPEGPPCGTGLKNNYFCRKK